jgi:TonB family protein
MREDALFAEALFDQPSLVKRLLDEFREASLEFRADPRAYIAAVVRDDRLGSQRRKALFHLGLAISIFIYAILFAATIIFWAVNAKPPLSVEEAPSYRIIPVPLFRPQNLMLPESDKQAQGGGGGGKNQPLPASAGLSPPFSLDPLIIAPTTRPTLQPPLLPVTEHLLGDVSLNVLRDEPAPTGLRDGVPSPPSDGPGKNGGIGPGKDGGVGPDRGPGEGPGEDGGKYDGKYSPGGRRSGSEAAQAVDTRPVPLNRPRPNYTEEARKNKVQGVVRARILVGADGTVKQVRLSGIGLPDGLNEEAIRAAYQMRFRPAIRSGQAVAHWISLEIEFNLR